MANSNCTGTVIVGGYTRSDGTEVSGYTRTCPYPHDNSEKSKLADTKRQKEALYERGYYKPSAGESVGSLSNMNNQNLTDAIKEFQTDNNLPATGTMNDLTRDALNDGVSMKFDNNMNDEDLLQKAQKEIVKNEGSPKHAYADTKGNVTVGKGKKINNR
ncbi:MAG: peptidoglycan-binding protein [Rickettsiales bacterium]|jgi:hypothetical protein|nr:peptidoglycan-binding protein [Rickettsiales bacterium]